MQFLSNMNTVEMKTMKNCKNDTHDGGMKCRVHKCKVMHVGKISFYFTYPVSDAELVIIIQE